MQNGSVSHRAVLQCAPSMGAINTFKTFVNFFQILLDKIADE